MTYVGECIGGPWNGQRLAHDQMSKKLFRPMIPFVLLEMMGNAPVIPVEIGEYRHDFNRWRWVPAKFGSES